MTILNVVAPPRGTGPTTWAQMLNTSFSAMDAHDHSDDNGSTVDSSTLNFNNDFSCESLTNWDFVGLQAGTLTAALTVRSNGLDLIAYDGIDREIYITKNGALNVSVMIGGGFIGDYVSAGAQATYTSISNTYRFFNGAAQLSSLTVGKASSATLAFPEVFNCVSFSVSVSASNSINFSLPIKAAGIAYRSGGVFSTTPYFTCSAASSIFSTAVIGIAGQNYLSFLTNGRIACTAKVNTVTKYAYLFTQGKGNVRENTVARQTNLSFPIPSQIPFVECGIQQAAPVIQYTTGSGNFRYKDPEIEYTVRGLGKFNYNSTLAYQVVFFQAQANGSPVAGGLGG